MSTELKWTEYNSEYLPPGVYLVQYSPLQCAYSADPVVFRTDYGGYDWCFYRYIDITDLPGVEPPIGNAV